MPNDQFYQWYHCTVCGLMRAVTLPEDCSTLKAVNTIKADHEEQSPSCPWNIDNIQVYSDPQLALRELNQRPCRTKGEMDDDK
jgi:hypothetical protein